MANKPIISIPVDDAQFREFYEMFQEFQGRLDSIPDDWKQIDDAARKAERAMTDIAGATDDSRKAMMIAAIQANAIAESMEKAVEAGRSFSKTSKEGSDSMSKIEKSAQGVAKSIFSIGGYLLKLGAIGGGIAGLGGLFGAIGLRDLAHNAVDTQNTARGIGVTPGELTAFRQDFGVYGFNEGILQRMADAQTDAKGQAFLALANGMGPGDIAKADPAQLAIDFLRKEGEWYKNTPPELRTAQFFQASGFAQNGGSINEARLAAASLDRFPQLSKDFESDAKKYNTSDATGDGWRGFLRQLSDAGNTIQTDLTNRLVALAPSLDSFISSITVDAKQLIDEVLTPANLKAISDGIGEMAHYLGSKEFRQDMRDFVGLLGAIVDAMRKAAKFLGISAPADTAPPSLDPGEVQRETHGLVPNFAGKSDIGSAQLTVDSTGASVDLSSGQSADAANKRNAAFVKSVTSGAGKAWNSIRSWVGDYLSGKDNDAIAQFGSRVGYGFDAAMPGSDIANLVALQAMAESHGDPNAVGPLTASGRAKGLLQFTDATAKTLGLANAHDPVASIAAAVKYDNMLAKKYSGDVRKVLAAYNWGPKHLDDDIAAHGAQWERYAPRQTRDYIDKITAALAKQKVEVNLKISNSTSANVAGQANAAGM